MPLLATIYGMLVLRGDHDAAIMLAFTVAGSTGKAPAERVRIMESNGTPQDGLTDKRKNT